MVVLLTKNCARYIWRVLLYVSLLGGWFMSPPFGNFDKKTAKSPFKTKLTALAVKEPFENSLGMI